MLTSPSRIYGPRHTPTSTPTPTPTPTHDARRTTHSECDLRWPREKFSLCSQCHTEEVEKARAEPFLFSINTEAREAAELEARSVAQQAQSGSLGAGAGDDDNGHRHRRSTRGLVAGNAAATSAVTIYCPPCSTHVSEACSHNTAIERAVAVARASGESSVAALERIIATALFARRVAPEVVAEVVAPAGSAPAALRAGSGVSETHDYSEDEDGFADAASNSDASMSGDGRGSPGPSSAAAATAVVTMAMDIDDDGDVASAPSADAVWARATSATSLPASSGESLATSSGDGGGASGSGSSGGKESSGYEQELPLQLLAFDALDVLSASCHDRHVVRCLAKEISTELAKNKRGSSGGGGSSKRYFGINARHRGAANAKVVPISKGIHGSAAGKAAVAPPHRRRSSRHDDATGASASPSLATAVATAVGSAVPAAPVGKGSSHRDGSGGSGGSGGGGGGDKRRSTRSSRKVKEEPAESAMEVDEGGGEDKIRRSRRTRGAAKKGEEAEDGSEEDDEEEEGKAKGKSCGGVDGVHCLTLRKLPALGDTSDPVPLVSNPVMDTRLGFLGLCQSNKYQFDCLRRAKASSMNLLYLMHNPDLPAYLFSCNECGEEIATGYRFNCPECPDFDLCQQCYQQQHRTGRVHPHKLKAISVNNGVVPEAMKVIKAERKKTIQRFLAALVHAEQCGGVEKGCQMVSPCRGRGRDAGR